MPADPNFAQTAALIGDPTRAAMLGALLGGKAQTASELAHSAGVTPQTASMHLARLVEGQLLRVVASGRHRYFQPAGPQVAQVLEALATIAPPARITSLREIRERPCGAICAHLLRPPGGHRWRGAHRAPDRARADLPQAMRPIRSPILAGAGSISRPSMCGAWGRGGVWRRAHASIGASGATTSRGRLAQRSPTCCSPEVGSCAPRAAARCG